jgi:hypothetical protein
MMTRVILPHLGSAVTLQQMQMGIAVEQYYAIADRLGVTRLKAAEILDDTVSKAKRTTTTPFDAIKNAKDRMMQHALGSTSPWPTN